jgi:hypothetical protein
MPKRKARDDEMDDEWEDIAIDLYFVQELTLNEVRKAMSLRGFDKSYVPLALRA